MKDAGLLDDMMLYFIENDNPSDEIMFVDLLSTSAT
jgi:hypothetical protein